MKIKNLSHEIMQAPLDRYCESKLFKVNFYHAQIFAN